MRRKQDKKNKAFGLLFYAWLGRKDSNPRMVGPEPTALPLGDALNFHNSITNH